MRLTYNWLKDFVGIPFSPNELADRMTMAGLEVTSLEKLKDDYVFEIEITSNRPDWLSVIGIAREIAALTGKKLKSVHSPHCPAVHRKADGRRATGDGRRDIHIEDKNACPFYSARIIRDVKVKPSPKWLAKRLQAIGLRPINNIVDITNYVLFTTGQPLHAFDLDKLKGKEISVRFAKDREEILTIDGIRRKLTPEILVIADEDNPIAIAGIMGGKESEVNEATHHILLESAYFSPVATRRASRYLGLSSDSSYRFERSVDKGNIVHASNFASSLILENGKGEIGALSRCGSDRVIKKTLGFDIDKANKLIGKGLTAGRIKSILDALGFRIGQRQKNILKIAVPAFRQDIKSQADLTEELCRISGYEFVPKTLPAIKPQGMREDAILPIQEKIRECLTAIGFSEAITYSLLSQEMLQKVRSGAQNYIRLENPLSSEQEILRPTLIAGLLPTLRRNLEWGNAPCAFFEIGDCFSPEGEFKALAIIKEKCDLIALKGALELLLQKLGIADYSFSQNPAPLFKDGQSASLNVAGRTIGGLGCLREEILHDFKIDTLDVAGLEINLEMLKSAVHFYKAYQPLPKYPSVMRDVSLIVDEAVSYQKVLDAIKVSQPLYLENIRFKDVYRSQGIGKGRKSLTLSLEFRSAQKTLTDAQVSASFEKLVNALSSSLGAKH